MSSIERAAESGQLLSNRRRILVAVYLLEEGPELPMSVGELATEVARLETEDTDHVDSDDRHAIYTGLVQDHLSPLDAANVIEYDEKRKMVDIGPNLRAYYASAVILGGVLNAQPLSV